MRCANTATFSPGLYWSVPQVSPLTTASREEYEELLSRILASRQISRAARLRSFLQFVVERYLDGATNIREQEVGAAVFDRTPDYDTSLDNIVRVNATELRKRLEQYFAEDGAGEELLLTIPRGSYLPVFSRRYDPTRIFDLAEPLEPEVATEDTTVVAPLEATQTLESRPAEPPVTAATERLRPGVSRAVATVMAVALALCAAGLWWQSVRLHAVAEPWRQDAEVERMWAPFFSGPTELDLVTADTSLALAKDVSGQAIPLDDYIHYRYSEPGAAATWSADRRADFEQVLDRNMVSLGDVHVAQKILRLNPYGKAMKLMSAREFTTEGVRQNNVVLIGSRQSNPWVDLFKDQVNFSLEYDLAQHRAYVVNRQPRPGEQARYQAPTSREGFAVVSLLPGLSPDRHVLIVGGTDGQATQAAGEFVTTARSLKQVMDRMPGKTLVPFEILLHTTQLTGTPLRTEVMAVRVAK